PYAGHTIRQGTTKFDKIWDKQTKNRSSPYSPFRDTDEWELACWLFENCTQSAADEFLKMKIISTRTKPSFTSSYTLMNAIDKLPTRSQWTCQHILVNRSGGIMAQDADTPAHQDEENLELWVRNPVNAVEELLGNPHFLEHLAYAPERIYSDGERLLRQIDEMWTADWWWETQVSYFTLEWLLEFKLLELANTVQAQFVPGRRVAQRAIA
ncbi:hypothetical protein CONPUDRAFT_53096, partial [Coniophora puteana RWD-64-598 SS2]